jgi:hypothetical protein
MSIERTDDEIDEQKNKALESDGRSKWPGMTYEQGVARALDWVTGYDDVAPMEDE